MKFEIFRMIDKWAVGVPQDGGTYFVLERFNTHLEAELYKYECDKLSPLEAPPYCFVPYGNGFAVVENITGQGAICKILGEYSTIGEARDKIIELHKNRPLHFFQMEQADLNYHPFKPKEEVMKNNIGPITIYFNEEIESQRVQSLIDTLNIDLRVKKVCQYYSDTFNEDKQKSAIIQKDEIIEQLLKFIKLLMQDKKS